MTSDPETKLGGGAGGDERATDMGALLEESLEYQSLERGKIIEGVVIGWDRDGVIVDIGSKSEGLVPRNEMHSLGADPQRKLQQGDKVLVSVLQPEAADGHTLLSIDRARGERGWRVLQERFESGECFEGEVTGYNKGGLLVNVDGVNAFVPLSQIVGIRPARDQEGNANGNSLADQVGRTLRLKVIEINRRRNRVILSERAALQEWRMEQKNRLIQELREGDIRRGRISSVRSFGVFVDLGGADGLAHLSELTWERGKTPAELFRVGDEVDVYVTKVDVENKKIALSLRRANPAQWEAVVSKYAEGQVVPALVTKLVAFGAFARVEGPVEGLIHVSELVDRRIGHPKEVVREGDLVPVKIVRIEHDRHRLGLSLRRAREEGEQMGFVFSDGGEVVSVPDEIRRQFEEREGPLPTPRPVKPKAAADEAVTVEAPTDTEPPADEVVTAEALTEVEPPADEAPAAEGGASGTAEQAAEPAPSESVTANEAAPLETTEPPAPEETTASAEELARAVAGEDPAHAAPPTFDPPAPTNAIPHTDEENEEPTAQHSPATPHD